MAVTFVFKGDRSRMIPMDMLLDVTARDDDSSERVVHRSLIGMDGWKSELVEPPDRPRQVGTSCAVITMLCLL